MHKAILEIQAEVEKIRREGESELNKGWRMGLVNAIVIIQNIRKKELI